MKLVKLEFRIHVIFQTLYATYIVTCYMLLLHVLGVTCFMVWVVCYMFYVKCHMLHVTCYIPVFYR